MPALDLTDPTQQALFDQLQEHRAMQNRARSGDQGVAELVRNTAAQSVPVTAAHAASVLGKNDLADSILGQRSVQNQPPGANIVYVPPVQTAGS